jgi:hypothetical protein
MDQNPKTQPVLFANMVLTKKKKKEERKKKREEVIFYARHSYT